MIVIKGWRGLSELRDSNNTNKGGLYTLNQ